MTKKKTRKDRNKHDGLNSHILEGRPNLLLSHSETLISRSLSRQKTLQVNFLAQNININPNKLNKCRVYQYVLIVTDSILGRLAGPFM
jgi:hypothetical protein